MTSTDDASIRESILKERAARLAAPLELTSHVRGRSMLIVQIGDEQVAFPVETVGDVTPMPRVARLPRLAPWFIGMTQHRGEPLALLELGELLGRSCCARSAVMLVLETSNETVAIATDGLVGIRDIAPDEHAKDLSSSVSHDSGFIEAVTLDLISIIDAKALFADPRLIVDTPLPESSATRRATRRRTSAPPPLSGSKRQENEE